VRGGLVALTLLWLAAGAVQGRSPSELQPGLIRPGGLPILFNSEGPLAFTGLTPKQIPRDAVPAGEVSGQSCQYSLAIPLSLSLRSLSISAAAGNGGYTRVLQRIERDHPALRGIYDVKVDLHQVVVLGVFEKFCTEVTALGYR